MTAAPAAADTAAVAEGPEAGAERARAETVASGRTEAAERRTVLRAGAVAPVPVFSAPPTAGGAGLRCVKGDS